MSVKIYLAANYQEYANWMQGQLVNSLEEADIVVFEGGEDVSPHIYGQPQHPTTSTNGRRDTREVELYNLAQELGKKCVGICRGLN